MGGPGEVFAFNEKGLACLDPRWAGGRPRQLKHDDENFVIATATTARSSSASRSPSGRCASWSPTCAKVHGRVIRICREALRCLLARRGVTFQRTQTWKESPDPERETKLDRIEHVLDRFPDRAFAFDEFGPLGIRPTAGAGWTEHGVPTGCRPPTTAPTESGTSTAATRWATIACGARIGARREP
ncbi:hypothetical protein QF032_007855 [Streptomyces achromogenes]|uniref:Transposase n=1 Tax=Streptomyces achromogenes TaxID=67255 RepID=A0ABU0QDW5_STRAH|nr:hypothetical protein [Streptomyces achromogenes]MDQ0836011.1 hypothetical protein [Streptomyces achromogenes]